PEGRGDPPRDTDRTAVDEGRDPGAISQPGVLRTGCVRGGGGGGSVLRETREGAHPPPERAARRAEPRPPGLPSLRPSRSGEDSPGGSAAADARAWGHHAEAKAAVGDGGDPSG